MSRGIIKSTIKSTKISIVMSVCKKISGVLLVAMLFSGCNNKGTTGAATGAVAGGLIGSMFGKGGGRVVGTGVGALIGTIIGGEIGNQLDERDRLLAESTMQSALESGPTGQRVPWNNPDSNNSGYVEAKPAYQNPKGQYCREYTTTIKVGNRTDTGYGLACRRPDGQWEIVK